MNKSRGKKLKELREELHLSQTELIEEIKKKLGKDKELNINTISNAENDKPIKTDTLEILVNFYGVSYDYLLNPHNDNKTNDNISINKVLGISDKAIEKISNLKEKDSIDVFNYFIENIDLDSFMKYLSDYVMYKKMIKIGVQVFQIQKLYELLDYYKEKNMIDKIENIVNYFSDIEKTFFIPPFEWSNKYEYLEDIHWSTNNLLDSVKQKYLSNRKLDEEEEYFLNEDISSTIELLERDIGYDMYRCSNSLNDFYSEIEGFDSIKNVEEKVITKEIEEFLKEQEKLINNKKIK